MSTYDVLRLASEAFCDPRSVRRLYAGELRSTNSLRARVTRAAQRLGLELPPSSARAPRRPRRDTEAA